VRFVASLGRAIADGIRRTLVVGALGDADRHLARVARQAYATGRSARSQVCSRGGRWLILHAEPYGDGLVSVGTPSATT